MYEIKFICPSCKFEQPWESVNLQGEICVRGVCESCFSSFIVVLHPSICCMRDCGIACSGYLSHSQTFKVTKYESRERTMFTLGEIVERMSSETEMARLFNDLLEE